MIPPKKVIILYSPDSDDHVTSVVRLSDDLRSKGVDACLDKYEPFPKEGWLEWTRSKIKWADVILLICTEQFCRKFEGRQEQMGEEDQKQGQIDYIHFAANIVLQHVQRPNASGKLIIPVLFEGTSDRCIPQELQVYGHYTLPVGMSDLYRVITEQPEYLAEELGEVQPLPQLNVKSEGAPEQVDELILEIPSDVAVAFVNVIIDVCSRVYLGGYVGASRVVRQEYLDYLKSTDCKAVRFLGKYLGCGVTRWYFHDRDETEKKLIPFHERRNGGIDLAWNNAQGKQGDVYNYCVLSEKEKIAMIDIQEQTGAVKSAEKFYEWFLTGDRMCTEFEDANNCVFVTYGELLAGTFEAVLRRQLTIRLSQPSGFPGTEKARIFGRPKDMAIIKKCPDFNKVVEVAQEQLINSIGKYSTHSACLNEIKFWLSSVLKCDPNVEGHDIEYSKWFVKEEMKNNWFLRLGEKALDQVAGIETWFDLALLIIEFGDYLFAEDDPKDATLNDLEHRLRFSPERERHLATRNLLFLPLWLGAKDKKITAPFNAFVIANFFDADRVKSALAMIRAVFTYLALPDVIEFVMDFHEAKHQVRLQTMIGIARGVGHDILNPLQEVRGVFDLLTELFLEQEPQSTKLIGEGLDSVEVAERRARNLLDAVRVRPLQLAEKMEISQIISHVVERVNRSKVCVTSRVHIEVGDIENVSISVDEERITRCLENVIYNAVEVSGLDENVMVETKLADNYIQVCVVDHGQGFDGVVRQAIFVNHMRKSTKRGHSGIGLLSSINILKAHGGKLEVAETGDTGTIISILIPINI